MSEIFILHFGKSIPIHREEGMDLLKKHFTDLKVKLKENTLEISDLQLSPQQD